MHVSPSKQNRKDISIGDYKQRQHLLKNETDANFMVYFIITGAMVNTSINFITYTVYITRIKMASKK